MKVNLDFFSEKGKNILWSCFNGPDARDDDYVKFKTVECFLNCLEVNGLIEYSKFPVKRFKIPEKYFDELERGGNNKKLTTFIPPSYDRLIDLIIFNSEEIRSRSEFARRALRYALETVAKENPEIKEWLK
jgi:hypothetical protein